MTASRFINTLGNFYIGVHEGQSIWIHRLDKVEILRFCRKGDLYRQDHVPIPIKDFKVLEKIFIRIILTKSYETTNI